MPGNDGEDADAIGAYTQIKLEDAARLLGLGVMPETWVSVPKSRQPAGWENIKDPVCPLILNLYGHPLAGLLWEKGSQEKLLKQVLKKFKDGKVSMFTANCNFSSMFTSTISTWQGVKAILHPCGRLWEN